MRTYDFTDINDYRIIETYGEIEIWEVGDQSRSKGIVMLSARGDFDQAVALIVGSASNRRFFHNQIQEKGARGLAYDPRTSF